MRAFSTDLRQRVLDAALADAALADGAVEQQVADRFGVSRGFVQKIKRRWRSAGTAEPVAQRRGPTPRITDGHRAALAERVRAVPDATDEEHRTWLAETRGVAVSVSTVNRTLAAMGLTRKKKSSGPRSATART